MENSLLTTAESAYYHRDQLAHFFKQACPYHSAEKETIAHFQQALRDIGYIGHMVTTQAGYEPALYNRLYSQLMGYGFKATLDNLNEFSEALATLICIALENLWLINYEIPDSPYYHAPFFNAIAEIMNTPATKEANQLLETLSRHITLNEYYPEIAEDEIIDNCQAA